MDISEIMEKVLGYLLAFICFWGIPLFFLYLMVKDLWKRKQRKEKLSQFLRTWKIGNPFLSDVERLIVGLNGFFPWDRPLATKKVIKMGSRGMDVVIATLDMPYIVGLGQWGSFVETQDFAEVFGNYFSPAHHLLVEMLVKIGRSHYEKLKDNLNHPNLNVRLSVMSAVGRIGNPSTIELLIPFLNSANTAERFGAMVILGDLRAKSVTEKIIASLRDENVGVREAGIRALMKIGDIRAIPALEELARIDQTIIDDRPILTIKDLAADAIRVIQKNNPSR